MGVMKSNINRLVVGVIVACLAALACFHNSFSQHRKLMPDCDYQLRPRILTERSWLSEAPGGRYGFYELEFRHPSEGRVTLTFLSFGRIRQVFRAPIYQVAALTTAPLALSALLILQAVTRRLRHQPPVPPGLR